MMHDGLAVFTRMFFGQITRHNQDIFWFPRSAWELPRPLRGSVHFLDVHGYFPTKREIHALIRLQGYRSRIASELF